MHYLYNSTRNRITFAKKQTNKQKRTNKQLNIFFVAVGNELPPVTIKSSHCSSKKSSKSQLSEVRAVIMWDRSYTIFLILNCYFKWF